MNIQMTLKYCTVNKWCKVVRWFVKKQFVCMPFFSKCVTFGSVGGDNLSGVGHLCKPRVNIMLFFSSREVEENRNSQCKV